MKKTKRRISQQETLNRTPVLRLSRETIRTLGPDDMERAVGGSCDTTSWTTEKTVNNTSNI